MMHATEQRNDMEMAEIVLEVPEQNLVWSCARHLVVFMGMSATINWRSL